MSDSVPPHGLQPTRLLRPWGSPGKNTAVGCHLVQKGSLVLPLEEGRCSGISQTALVITATALCCLMGQGLDASSPLSTQSCTSESKQSPDEASLVLQEKTIAFYLYSVLAKLTYLHPHPGS